MLELEGVVVSVLDRLGREDVRLHQPRCHNASAIGLQGYIDHTLPSRCYATPCLHCQRLIFEHPTIPVGVIGWLFGGAVYLAQAVEYSVQAGRAPRVPFE